MNEITAPTAQETSKVPIPGRHKDLSDFLGTLFRLLEELNLRYCLLVEPPTDTRACSSGPEIIVHPEGRTRLPLLFQKLGEEGYQPLQCVPLGVGDSRYEFAGALDGGARFFSLTIRETFPMGGLFAVDNRILDRRQNRGKYWVACEADQFCYMLSKLSLEGTVTEGQGDQLRQLAESLRSSGAKKVLGQLFGQKLQEEVLSACAGGQWDGILERLRVQVRRAKLRRASLGWLVHALLRQFGWALQRWFQPSGMYMVILGPDGAGKSTLTNTILERLRPLFDHSRIFQWRPQVIKPRARYSPWFNPPHDKPPHGAVESIFRIFSVLFDYWVGYPTVIRPLLARAGLAIYDRDFHDLLVDRLRYRYGGPHWLPGLVAKLLPRPETLYLTLDAETDVILSRKQEVAPDELRRQRIAYAELAAKLPNSTLIRTDQGFEASTSAAMGAILTYLARRFEYRQRGALPCPLEEANRDQTSSQTVPSTGDDHHNSSSGIQNWVELCTKWKVWFFKASMAITDQGLISGSNFVLSVVLARYLSASQYGTYAVALSTFVLFSLIHQALVLEPMSILGASLYRDSVRHYMSLLTWLQLGFSVIVVICLASVGIAGSVLNEPSRLTVAFIGMGVASPFVLLFWFARRAHYLHMLPGRAVIGAIIYSALLALGIGALHYGRVLSPFTAFLVMGVSALFASILLLIRLHSVKDSTVTVVRPTVRQVSLQHWQYGGWALLSMVFLWIPWNILYSVVTRFCGLAATGTLIALLNLALPMTATYGAFSMLVMPYTARLGMEGGWKAVRVQAWKLAGLFVAGSGVYWLVIYLFRDELIHFLYKGQYAEVIPLVPVVAVSSILAGAAMGPTIAIKAMRSPATTSRVYFGASLVSIIVGIPACRAWGYRGAVLAILLSSLTACIAGFLKCSDPQQRYGHASALGAKQIAPDFSRPASRDVQQQMP